MTDSSRSEPRWTPWLHTGPAAGACQRSRSTYTALVVRPEARVLDPAGGRERNISKAEYAQMVGRIREVARPLRGEGIDVHLAGHPVVAAALDEALLEDMRRTAPLALLVAVAFLALAFRRLSGVVHPCLGGTVTGSVALFARTIDNAVTSMARSYVLAGLAVTLLMVLLLGGLRLGSFPTNSLHVAGITDPSPLPALRRKTGTSKYRHLRRALAAGRLGAPGAVSKADLAFGAVRNL